MKILLAVDGSAYTQKMLAYLTSHQEMLGTGHEYTIITVQPLLPPRARAALGRDVVEQYYDEESTKILQPVQEFLNGRGVQVQSISKVGPIADTIINTLVNVSGIVCDGAKSSCAAKISSAVDAAITAHDLSMQGKVFPAGEGIVKGDVEETIRSVSRLAREGMRETDIEVLHIMID